MLKIFWKRRKRQQRKDEEDFVPKSKPKKKFSVFETGVKKSIKRACTEAEKMAGKSKGMERAKKSLFKP